VEGCVQPHAPAILQFGKDYITDSVQFKSWPTRGVDKEVPASARNAFPANHLVACHFIDGISGHVTSLTEAKHMSCHTERQIKRSICSNYAERLKRYSRHSSIGNY